jgi:hypothetical protein
MAPACNHVHPVIIALKLVRHDIDVQLFLGQKLF